MKSNAKHRRHFSFTLFVSFLVHLFALTILFTTPHFDDPGNYKKVRVRIGTTNSTEDNLSRATKYAAYDQGANQSQAQQRQILGNSTDNIPAIIAAQEPGAGDAAPPYDKQNQTAATPSAALETLKHPPVGENNAQIPAAGKAHIAQQHEILAQNATDPSQAESLPAPVAAIGNIIGNSNDYNADKLMSYEQMLPLWLHKFKKYPPEAREKNLSGTGKIFMTTDRKGKVLLSRIEKSTGTKILDRALMKMVTDADPVLPVPDSYYPKRKTLSYVIEFEFTQENNNDQQN